MDILSQAWPVIMVVASVVAGVVGLVVHALTIRKSSLEIQKLRYEIERIKHEQDQQDRLVQIADFHQVRDFAMSNVDEAREGYRLDRGLNRNGLLWWVSLALLLCILIWLLARYYG